MKYKDIYMAIKLSKKPAQGLAPQSNEFKKNPRWEIIEYVTITDDLKNNTISESKFIYNITKNKIKINNLNTDWDENTLIVYYLDKYENEIVKFLTTFRKDMLDDIHKNKGD